MKRLIWTKIVLAFMAILAFTTFGVSVTTVYEYYDNTKIIKNYESRITQINKRFKEKRIINKKPPAITEEQQQLKKELGYLRSHIQKSMRSVPLILDVIEKVKPKKVDIHELVLSDDLMGLTIKGESKFVDDVSKFVIDMNRSTQFDVEITSQSYEENKKISFKLTARWINLKDDQKI